MRIRRIAIMIDAGFFLKRLKSLNLEKSNVDSATGVVKTIKHMCRLHVAKLTSCKPAGRDWLDHTYRIFFYDAAPFDKQAHNPLTNKRIDFSKSDEAKFRNELFKELRRTRKVALRLGLVKRQGDWTPPSEKVRKILPTRKLFNELDLDQNNNLTLNEDQKEVFAQMKRRWSEIEDHEIKLELRQKGVDMRIGIDIASVTLKNQVDTIVLISGDSDFVPAAKLARREGVEFILDPLGQKINEDLFEHIDGLQSILSKTKGK